MGHKSHGKDEAHRGEWALKTPFVVQDFLYLSFLIGDGKNNLPGGEGETGKGSLFIRD